MSVPCIKLAAYVLCVHATAPGAEAARVSPTCRVLPRLDRRAADLRDRGPVGDPFRGGVDGPLPIFLFGVVEEKTCSFLMHILYEGRHLLSAGCPAASGTWQLAGYLVSAAVYARGRGQLTGYLVSAAASVYA